MLEMDKKRCRTVFDLLFEKPHIAMWQIREALKMRNIRRLMEKISSLQCISGPELRKRSFQNIGEHTYFIRCEDSESMYLELRKDQRVSFHASMSGFCDLWITSKEEIDIEGEVVVKGVRSDFYVSKPPDHSWEEALKIMKKKIDEFDPKNYTLRRYIQTHWNETVEWDEKDEFLFRYFKYDLRRPLGPLLKEKRVSREGIRAFLDKLPQCCTISTLYFPEGFCSYDSYLFMFETDHEDFIIDLFSELPTTSTFFKVSDRLFVYIHVPKHLVRGIDLEAATIDEYIPLLIRNLVKKGIVKRKVRAMVDYFWGKDL